MTYRDPVSIECWDQDSQPRLPDSRVHIPTPAVSQHITRRFYRYTLWRVYPLPSPLMAHALCGLGLWTPEFWVGCESSGRMEGSWCLTEVSICFRETSRKSRRWLNWSDLKLASYQLQCGPFGRLLFLSELQAPHHPPSFDLNGQGWLRVGSWRERPGRTSGSPPLWSPHTLRSALHEIKLSWAVSLRQCLRQTWSCVPALLKCFQKLPRAASVPA